MNHILRRVCYSFEEFRQTAYEAVGRDPTLFEQIFVSDFDKVILADDLLDGDLSPYKESNWKGNLPKRYPVIVFSNFWTVNDVLHSPTTEVHTDRRILNWDWAYLDVLMKDELETIRLALLDRKASVEALVRTRPFWKKALQDVQNLFNKLFPKG